MEIRFIDPSGDFSNGIKVLHAYHESLLEHGALLVELASDIHRDGISEAKANRAIELHCYYTRANSLHHQDEEKALFPLILNRNLLIDGMIERLTLDHEEIETVWLAISKQIRDPENLNSTWLLLEKIREFERLQREHLIRENEDFLPTVEKTLSSSEQHILGRLMAKMRGLPELSVGVCLV